MKPLVAAGGGRETETELRRTRGPAEAWAKSIGMEAGREPARFLPAAGPAIRSGRRALFFCQTIYIVNVL